MIYQKLLSGRDPFFVSAGPSQAFEKHYHHEIELTFCVRGQYPLIVGGKHYFLHEGELALINSPALHEYPNAPADSLRLTLELGPALLGDFFAPVAAQSADCEICRPGAQLLSLLQETADACLHHRPFSELLIKGNAYKLGAVLLRDFWLVKRPTLAAKTSRDIRGIEKALEIIYNRYHEPLDIATVSRECGYEKSNFCKVFKANTGDTFHQLLNKHRIDIACTLLTERELSIEQIAFSVGFSDVKSFCRVFKATKGETAGRYRKQAATPIVAP